MKVVGPQQYFSLVHPIRLSVIDESSFLSVCHSDISYDRTDDDVVNASLTLAGGDAVPHCLLNDDPLLS